MTQSCRDSIGQKASLVSAPIAVTMEGLPGNHEVCGLPEPVSTCLCLPGYPCGAGIGVDDDLHTLQEMRTFEFLRGPGEAAPIKIKSGIQACLTGLEPAEPEASTTTSPTSGAGGVPECMLDQERPLVQVRASLDLACFLLCSVVHQLSLCRKQRASDPQCAFVCVPSSGAAQGEQVGPDVDAVQAASDPYPVFMCVPAATSVVLDMGTGSFGDVQPVEPFEWQPICAASELISTQVEQREDAEPRAVGRGRMIALCVELYVHERLMRSPCVNSDMKDEGMQISDNYTSPNASVDGDGPPVAYPVRELHVAVGIAEGCPNRDDATCPDGDGATRHLPLEDQTRGGQIRVVRNASPTDVDSRRADSYSCGTRDGYGGARTNLDGEHSALQPESLCHAPARPSSRCEEIWRGGRNRPRITVSEN